MPPPVEPDADPSWWDNLTEDEREEVRKLADRTREDAKQLRDALDSGVLGWTALEQCILDHRDHA